MGKLGNLICFKLAATNSFADCNLLVTKITEVR